MIKYQTKFIRRIKMENIEKIGALFIKSGDDAKQVVDLLIKAGLDVSRESCDKTHTKYEIFKKK